jgi:hypothetical protein
MSAIGGAHSVPTSAATSSASLQCSVEAYTSYTNRFSRLGLPSTEQWRRTAGADTSSSSSSSCGVHGAQFASCVLCNCGDAQHNRAYTFVYACRSAAARSASAAGPTGVASLCCVCQSSLMSLNTLWCCQLLLLRSFWRCCTGLWSVCRKAEGARST